MSTKHVVKYIKIFGNGEGYPFPKPNLFYEVTNKQKNLKLYYID